jgi:hypothetical protein
MSTILRVWRFCTMPTNHCNSYTTHNTYTTLNTIRTTHYTYDLAGAWYCADDDGALTTDMLWEELVAAAAQRRPILLSNHHNESAAEDDCLVPEHAYTALWAREIGGYRLIMVRNPHGAGGKEWDGDWGDSSYLWAEHPAVARAAGFSPGDDGVFYMCMADVERVFEAILIWGKTISPAPEAAEAFDSALGVCEDISREGSALQMNAEELGDGAAERPLLVQDENPTFEKTSYGFRSLPRDTPRFSAEPAGEGTSELQKKAAKKKKDWEAFYLEDFLFTSLGSSRPLTGKQFHNSLLCEALRSKCRFTLAELQQLEVHCRKPGLRWEEIGVDKPQTGTEIHCPELATALQKTAKFSAGERDRLEQLIVDSVGLATRFVFDCYIRVGDTHFKPSDTILSNLSSSSYIAVGDSFMQLAAPRFPIRRLQAVYEVELKLRKLEAAAEAAVLAETVAKDAKHKAEHFQSLEDGGGSFMGGPPAGRQAKREAESAESREAAVPEKASPRPAAEQPKAEQPKDAQMCWSTTHCGLGLRLDPRRHSARRDPIPRWASVLGDKPMRSGRYRWSFKFSETQSSGRLRYMMVGIATANMPLDAMPSSSNLKTHECIVWDSKKGAFLAFCASPASVQDPPVCLKGDVLSLILDLSEGWVEFREGR